MGIIYNYFACSFKNRERARLLSVHINQTDKILMVHIKINSFKGVKIAISVLISFNILV